MTLNLFDLTYQLGTELGIMHEGGATGGTTTTLIDTYRRTEADDYWNGGHLWILYDAAGAGASPEGEFSPITDFDQGTSTITLATTLGAAPATGDIYVVSNKKFPISDLKIAINRAIRDIGPIPTVDTTTIDTAAAQTEYTPPAAANDDLREVWLQWITNDANDNQWYPVRNWYQQRTAAGTADTLVFPEQPMYPRDVKLVYMAPHSRLNYRADKLHETINYKRVIYRAAVYALNHYRMRTMNTDEYLLQTIRDYEQRADQADLMYPIKAPKKLGRMMRVSAAEAVELAPGENKIP
jgi:hypothetical protein